MGRQSSLHEHFVRVKTPTVLERFEVEKSRVFPPGIPRNHGTPGSCLKPAESRAASSPWDGGHRYTDILCMLKLPWAQRNLMLENLATGTSLSDIV